MFKPLPMVYDKDDEDLYHEFRKCMFSRRIKEGTYKFVSKSSESWMTYEIVKGRIYKRSYGEVNGTPIRIEV
jgi:hypothetical protein